MKYQILRFLTTTLARIGFDGMWRLAAILGFTCWYVMPRRRRMAIAAVHKHLKVPLTEAKSIARRSFDHNLLSFIEVVLADQVFFDDQRLVTMNPEILAAFMADPRPIVVATAHLGAWELLAGLAKFMFPDRRRMVIVRRQKDPAVNKLMTELRGVWGMQVIDHRKASAQVLEGLREKGVAAFLVDHNTARNEAVFLPFLEDTAAVTLGPALLALRAKAVVYPAFMVRNAEGRYTFEIHDKLDTTTLTGTVAERAEAIARFYTQAVENVIRRHPEQWFWMHNRWKTKP